MRNRKDRDLCACGNIKAKVSVQCLACWRPPQISKACEVCQKPFLSIRSKRRRFCGKSCAATSRAPGGVTFAERFEFYTMPEPNSGCLLWLGYVDKNGYGRFAGPSRSRLAHVASWELHNKREVPAGLCVLHKCDVPGCVEPKHLWLGSMQDNTDDMHKKGRWVRPSLKRGSSNWKAKLTEADIPSIRSDPRNALEVAEQYGVNASTINKIRRRQGWTHVP